MEQIAIVNTFKKYYRTLWYLKPCQVFGRLWFKCYKPKVSKGLQQLSISPASHEWVPSPPQFGNFWDFSKKIPIFHTGHQDFFFNSYEFWNNPKINALQKYYHHYFNGIHYSYHKKWLEIFQNWEKNNPQGTTPAWDPYPTSLRIVNCIIAHLCYQKLSAPSISSLATQLRYLQKRFEYHLQGNHLLVNAKANIFGGCFFNGQEAHKWKNMGCRIFNQELSKQIMSDGMHAEMSPFYHALVLLDLLDLINLAKIYPYKINSDNQTLWQQTALKMLSTLECLTHPDDQIASFGDTSLDDLPKTSAIKKYAYQLGLNVKPLQKQPIIHLIDSGYVRLSNQDIVLIIKAGTLGYDHLLSHAHADSLTFELSQKGQRLIVDTGTDHYGIDQERFYQRNTFAHNTVVVDHQNSSEIWSNFRMARRAYPINIETFQKKNGTLVCRCNHNGYQRLSDPVIHHRTFQLKSNQLKIIDKMQAKKKHTYSFQIYTTQPMQIICQNQQLEPETTEYYPAFGKAQKAFRYQKEFTVIGTYSIVTVINKLLCSKDLQDL